jgi:hypothetical protein
MVPDRFFTAYMGAGLPAMLVMLAAGIPLYVCATASTPIAAALILKGVSPGAALVFLLAGPATNIATMTVLIGTLGKRATAIYLASIALCALMFGLMVDRIYALLGLSATAALGRAAETIPQGVALAGGVVLILLSIRPLWRGTISRFSPPPADPVERRNTLPVSGCGPG